MNNFFKSKLMKTILKGMITLSIVINIGLFTILFTPLNEWTHQLLLINFEPRESDVIVICSSNFPFNTEVGLPDLSTLVRMEKGLRLYRSGYADKIIVFGGIWMEKAKKTMAEAMKERLLLYGIPEEDIIVQDEIMGKLQYYENLLAMMETHKDRFDFNRAMFVTSADQSFRLYHALLSEIKEPIIITGEPYEFTGDWGKRFHIFRRIANEILFGIPYFYISDRFAVPSTFDFDYQNWKRENPDKIKLNFIRGR